MNPLWIACRHPEDYPLRGTLLDQLFFEHHLENYSQKLNEREKSLFCPESKIDVKLLEATRTITQGQLKWQSKPIKTYDALKTHLGVSDTGLLTGTIPEARFIFIWAQHSKDHLLCSRKVLMLLFTYHQIMPDFLDFLFPFGLQQYPQDAAFNDFRVQCRLKDAARGMDLPTLGLSGFDCRMCYGLKGVESTPDDPVGPYSVRQASLYHCFDVRTGLSTWMIIKGNLLLQRRIEKLAAAMPSSKTGNANQLTAKFSASLQTHLWMCDWAGEQWRWYLNFLEEEFQQRSRQIFSVQVTEYKRTSFTTNKSLLKAFTWSEDETRSALPTFTSQPSSVAPLSQPPPPGNPPPGPPPGHPAANGSAIPMEKLQRKVEPPRSNKVFNFEDYMRLQYMKEKANEAQLVLESNADIISRISAHYETILSSPEWPEAIRVDAREELIEFLSRLDAAKARMVMQRSRAQVLLGTLENRTNILNGILEYENTQETIKSTVSAERLTQEMHKVALRTARQTALMLLIALVTVIYLPATFISTMMSTDIVNWNKDPAGESVKVFQWPALLMFLYTSLPLTAITLAGCGAYYWRYVRGNKGTSSGAYGSFGSGV